MGFRLQGFGFRISGSGFLVQGFEARVSGSGFWGRGSGSGFSIHGFEARASGSGFRVQGLVFRFSCFVFPILPARFRLSDARTGFSVYGLVGVSPLLVTSPRITCGKVLG